jgi:hypothetical protein
VIDDLLDARDDLEELLDEALPALAARPSAEGAEVLAVLLTAPGRRTGPDARLRRLVVRHLEARGGAEAAAVLEAVAALADPDTAHRAGLALERLAGQGVRPAIAGIGETALVEGWRVELPPAEGLAVRVRRPGEPADRLLKLWLEPGEEGQRGLLAGGWTEPLDDRRLEKDRRRFERMAAADAGDETPPDAQPLGAEAAAAAVDALVRRASGLGLSLSEGVALVLAQVRRAAGSPSWPEFDVLALPGEGRPAPGRGRRR